MVRHDERQTCGKTKDSYRPAGKESSRNYELFPGIDMRGLMGVLKIGYVVLKERWMMVPTLAFILGPAEMIFVGIIVLVLFGSRLPSVMRSLGQSVTSFKSGLNDDSDDLPDPILNQKKK